MTQLKQWTNDAWGGFLFFFISLNEIFGFWKLKISFTEMFHESVKKNSLIGISCKDTLWN